MISIKSAYDDGYSLRQIMKEFSVSMSTVKKELYKEGVQYEKLFTDYPWILEAIAMYQEGLNFSDIARKVSKTSTLVRNVLIERGFAETKSPNVTKDQKQEIVILYDQGLSSDKIAKQLGLSRTTVKEYIPDYMKRKKAFYNTYSCNYQFFENIDNEINAYFLGLFYADGYNNQKIKTVRLGFAEKDKELLDKFLTAINSNHPIKITEKEGNAQLFYYVDISSPILSNDLVKHGCVQAKTHLLDKMPEMSNELYRHFIRGYFDGDGSVYYTDNGRGQDKITLSWTGNKPFLEDVQAYLIKELEVSKTAIYITHPDRNNLIGDLRYSNGTATKIHNWMYSDCQYYSERKKMIPVLRPQVLEEKGREYARSVMDEFYNKINKIN